MRQLRPFDLSVQAATSISATTRPRHGRWTALAVLACVAVGSARLGAQHTSTDGGRAAPSEPSIESNGKAIEPPAPLAPEVIARDTAGHATMRAVRVPALDVDGNLDDQAYETIRPIDGFVQSVPDVGQPATQKTEAWILFDDRN